jgi:CheY-like chemotaxis protein
MNDGPVLIVDNDEEDWEFLQAAWKEPGYTNALLFFHTGKEVFHYLNKEEPVPFLILCDVNIPGMEGFELKKKIMEPDRLNYKSIPFVFWSTAVSIEQIRKAYD